VDEKITVLSNQVKVYGSVFWPRDVALALIKLYTEMNFKKAVGLERVPLSLVSTTEELLDRKVAAPV
jgi:hypothetical protein